MLRCQGAQDMGLRYSTINFNPR